MTMSRSFDNTILVTRNREQKAKREGEGEGEN